MTSEDDAIDTLVRTETATIKMFAKMQIEGTPTGLDRDDWYRAIERRAEQRYGQRELSEAQKFASRASRTTSTC
jgi:hypothetical protein